MKLAKTLPVFTLSLFIVFYYTSCQTDTILAPDKMNQEKITKGETLKLSKSLSSVDKLKQIARELAILFEDQNNRILLHTEISTSKNYEQILIAPEFFNKSIENEASKTNARIEKIKDKISKHLFGKEKEEMDIYLNTLAKGVIDIYFPYPEHRKNFTPSQKILVAPLTKSLIQNEQLIAYNYKGEEVVISSKQPSEIPTLVVCFSEKRGVYNDKDLADQLQNEVNTIVNTTSSTIWYFNVNRVYVQQNYDGGVLGDMELYAKANNEMYYTNNWSGWHGGYYNSNHSLGTVSPSTYVAVNANIGCAYFANARYIVELWEYDDWFSGGDDQVSDSNWNDAYTADYEGNIISYWGSNIYYLTGSPTTLRLHDGNSNDNDYLFVYGSSN